MSGWATGALLSVFGSTAGNLGVNMQKYSLTQEGRRPMPDRRPIWKQKRYLGGLGLIVFGSLGDFAALSMAAQSIIAPLGSFALVANIIFAHFWLKEDIGWREFVGTALIILGSVLSVVFGDHSDKSYTNQELLDLLSGGLFIAYLVVVLLIIFGGGALLARITPWKRQLVELEAAQLLKDFQEGKVGADAQATLQDVAVVNGVNQTDPAAALSSPPSSPIIAASAAGARTHAPPSLPSPSPSSSSASRAPRSGASTGADGAALTAAAASAASPTSVVPITPAHLRRLERAQSYRMLPSNLHAGIAALDTGVNAVTLVPTNNPEDLDLSLLPGLRERFAPYARVHPFLLCALSGTLGAQSILFSKNFSVLLATSVEGNNQMLYFFPWVCLIGMIIMIFSQLYVMSQALAFYDSLYVVPVFQCFFIMISACGGAAYFREVDNFTQLQTIMFPVGFAITLAGVAILTLRSRAAKAELAARQRHKMLTEARRADAVAKGKAGTPDETEQDEAKDGKKLRRSLDGDGAVSPRDASTSPQQLLTQDSTAAASSSAGGSGLLVRTARPNLHAVVGDHPKTPLLGASGGGNDGDDESPIAGAVTAAGGTTAVAGAPKNNSYKPPSPHHHHRNLIATEAEAAASPRVEPSPSASASEVVIHAEE